MWTEAIFPSELSDILSEQTFEDQYGDDENEEVEFDNADNIVFEDVVCAKHFLILFFNFDSTQEFSFFYIWCKTHIIQNTPLINFFVCSREGLVILKTWLWCHQDAYMYITLTINFLECLYMFLH